MKWMDISLQPPDESRIHFLTNGRTVFMKGTQIQPFLLQLFGELTTICDFEPTHWTTLPDLPVLNMGFKFNNKVWCGKKWDKNQTDEKINSEK